MAESELCDLVVQLAQFCRVNDPTALQVLECTAQLSGIDLSALDRFFSLFLSYSKQISTHSISGHSSRVRAGGPPASVTATRTVSAGRSHVRQHLHSTISPSSKYQEFSSIRQREDERSKDVDDQLPRSPGPGGSNPSAQSPLYPPFNANTVITSSLIRETTPQLIATDVDTVGTLTFSPSTKLLLESCKTDRGRFLREIEEARTALPTGQGWEAAIATKEHNADMRDRNKIYHRFECYNIYKHVVEAGYHTGTHWIRDMRMALANKLCQEFPQRFPDEKAANKSLNWVDQGCKYHEWAGQFISEGTSLGHLIALPLDVPHSTYTSRCTQKRMRSIAIQLHTLRIDDLVKEFELAELGDHIAATLRDMTGRKRKNIPDGTYGSQKLPRLTSCRSPRHSLSVQSPDQNPTPPASLAASWDGYNYSALEMDYAVDGRPFDQSTTSLNVCRSIAETYAVPYNSPLNLSTYDFVGTLALYANYEPTDLSPSSYSGLLQNPDYNAALEPFDELCWDAITPRVCRN